MHLLSAWIHQCDTVATISTHGLRTAHCDACVSLTLHSAVQCTLDVHFTLFISLFIFPPSVLIRILWSILLVCPLPCNAYVTNRNQLFYGFVFVKCSTTAIKKNLISLVLLDCGFFFITFVFLCPTLASWEENTRSTHLNRPIPNLRCRYVCALYEYVTFVSQTLYLLCRFWCVGDWSSLPFMRHDKNSEIENENSAATNHLPQYHTTQKPLNAIRSSRPRYKRKIFF